MQTLEALKRRIATTQDLRSIVRTMKSLSAVSIRHFDAASAAVDELIATVETGLQALVRLHGPHVATDDPSGTPAGVIVFGSDRGLCGRFNELIATAAARRIRRLRTVGAQPRVLAVGARGAARLESLGCAPEEILFLPGSVDGLSKTAQSILIKVDEWRMEHRVRRVEICANRREDSATAVAHIRQILPFHENDLAALATKPWGSRCVPMLTTSPGILLSWLIRQHVFARVFAAGAESIASEHASRLAAMQTAERSIEDSLEEMNAAYRYERQSSITTELLDVVAGYMSLMDHDSAGGDDASQGESTP